MVEWQHGGRFGAMWKWHWVVVVLVFECGGGIGWFGVVVMEVWGRGI